MKFYHVLVHLAIQKLCHATQPPRSSECRDTADILWVLQAPEQCQILSLSHLSPIKYGRHMNAFLGPNSIALSGRSGSMASRLNEHEHSNHGNVANPYSKYLKTPTRNPTQLNGRKEACKLQTTKAQANHQCPGFALPSSDIFEDCV